DSSGSSHVVGGATGPVGGGPSALTRRPGRCQGGGVAVPAPVAAPASEPHRTAPTVQPSGRLARTFHVRTTLTSRLAAVTVALVMLAGCAGPDRGVAGSGPGEDPAVVPVPG